MATKKITELSQANSVANNDLLVIVTNPASLSETKKVTVNTFFSNVVATKVTTTGPVTIGNTLNVTSNTVLSGNVYLTSPVLISGSMTVTTNATYSQTLTANQIIINDRRTPANSTIDITAGTLFYDNTYLYIAVSQNLIKRIQLVSF